MPLTQQVLTKYPNTFFIETGTYHGEASFIAEGMGFRVYTIECNKGFHNNCQIRFRGHKNIHLYHGNSGELLPKILKELNDNVTVWLDAHPPDDYLTVKSCPILQELKAIYNEMNRLKFKILIDDMRLFREKDMNQILDIANKIGKISYEASKCGEKDIMAIT